MSDEFIVSIVTILSGTVIGLAALWRNKNVELQVVAKQVGVQLRIIEPTRRPQVGPSADATDLGASPESK